MTHLYLIRHGDATTTGANTFEDPRLTPLGVAQAERLRDRLAATGEIRADILIASTMARAWQTAEIVAPALGLSIIPNNDVQEWRFPEDEMIDVDAYVDYFKSLPDEQKPFYQIVPHAESWVQFMLRACTALNHLIQQYEDKTIVIICHGGIVDASFHFFLRLSTIHLPPSYFDTHNTSITHWYRTSHHPVEQTPNWTLERYNDVMHLCDLNQYDKLWND